MIAPQDKRVADVLAGLFDDLREAGYNDVNVRPATGGSMEPSGVPTRIEVLALPDLALATLTKLFLFTDAVEIGEVHEALPASRLDDLRQIGALTDDGSHTRSLISIFPYEGLLIAADARRYRETDFVNGPGPSAFTLANLTVRRSVPTTLDLGTGSGIQALLAARRSDQVVATDVNPRAVGYARLNAGLNGFANVDCRAGSWFEPVGDMRFEMITANLPFVISPETHWIYRDSGPRRDAVCREVVQEAATHLAEGGFAQITCSWIHSAENDWLDPIRAWVDELQCDVLVLHHMSLDPVRYAGAWNSELTSNPAEYERAVKAWVAYYRAHEVRYLATGVLVLRRARETSTWVHALQIPGTVRSSASDQLMRIFVGRDFLHRHQNSASRLGHAYGLVEGHQVNQTMVYRDGTYVAGEPTISLSSGISTPVRLDPETVHVLFRLDGRRQLSDIVAQTAAETGFDAASLSAKSVAMVRDLLRAGILTVPDQPPAASSGEEA